MIRKLLAMSLASILIFSTVGPVYAETAQQTGENSSKENYIDLSVSINEEEMYQIADKVDDYFILEADGTISIDASAEELGTTPELLNQYKKGLESINLAIEQGYLKVNDDFSLSAVEQEEPLIQPMWIWYSEFGGTYFQLATHEAEELVDTLEDWARTSTTASAIAAYISTKGVPYSAGATLASALLSVGLSSAADQIEDQMYITHGVVIFISNWNPFNVLQVSPL